MPKAPAASEPIAWATLALRNAYGLKLVDTDVSNVGSEWLARQQQKDGSVGVTIDQKTPAWTTSLAISVWQAVDSEKYAQPIDQGIDWALDQKPWTRPKHENFGHDTMLEGWSWAADTHSWLEPTAFFVRAFQATGKTDHPRYQQAVALLIDRLLPAGGANYGNTIILGQELLQHLQPTGIVAWALAEEVVNDSRMAMTLDYLESTATLPTGVASLAYATLGLAANGRDIQKLTPLLNEAAQHALAAGGIHKTALVTLAIQAMLNQLNNQLGAVT